MKTGAYFIAAFFALAAPAFGCDERSWVGGTTEWCDGAFVYRDYVYDDDGADQGTISPYGAPLNPGTGDVDSRRHGQSLNSTDLLALRLRAVGDRLVARFELNTLLPGDRTIAALALDTDDNRATGGGPWPGVDVSSGGWEHVYVLRDRDAAHNVITGSVPLPAHGFRVQAVVALGDGTPMNVAFRPHDHGNWWEDDQAAALAKGDISAFGAEVSLAEARAGLDRPARDPGPGFYERVYTSRHALGEGFDPQGVEGSTPAPYGFDGVQGSTATFQYLGTHQPYAVYVPPGRAPHGAEVVLHGLNASFASLVNQPGAQRALGDGQNRVLISPEGRGAANYYIDWGARDVLDALADAEDHYAIDRDTVVLSGYSMGGLGTLQLATWFPDRWAAGISWVGFTGDCLNGTPLAQGRQRPAPLSALAGVNPYFSNSPEARDGCDLGTRGNALDYLENTRHVPVAYLFAAQDELAWPNHALAVAQREQELGYVHRFWLHAGEHLTLALLDDWRKEAAWTHGARLVAEPAHVTYRTNTYLWVPKLDLVPDGAYWVHQIRPRRDAKTPDGDMVVDLTSHACPTLDPRVEIHRDAGTDPAPWVGQEGVAVGREPVAPGARITGTLTNVASLLIDVRRACLRPGEPVALDLHSDGPAVVRFSDGRAPVAVG